MKNIKTSELFSYRLENYMPCLNINYFDGKDSAELHLVTKVQKINLIYINNKRYKIIKKFSKLQKKQLMKLIIIKMRKKC